MSFSFTWNLLTITEVLGLTLAVIGFFNLSQKLEDMFGRVREYATRFSTYEIDRAKKLWPPHKHVKVLSLSIFDSLPSVIVVSVGYLWLSGYLPYVQDFVVSLSVAGKMIFWLCVGLSLVVNEFFAYYVLTRILWGVSSMLEKLFWLLGKPPAGVTGTLGLILSVVSFGLTHIVGKVG